MRYLFGHFKEYFLGMLGKKREGTLTISNIGRFPWSSEPEGMGGWSIGSMYFGQCDATCGTMMKMNIVGSPSGSLGVSFTWGQGAIEDDIAEVFVHLMQVGLEVLVLEHAS